MRSSGRREARVVFCCLVLSCVALSAPGGSVRCKLTRREVGLGCRSAVGTEKEERREARDPPSRSNSNNAAAAPYCKWQQHLPQITHCCAIVGKPGAPVFRWRRSCFFCFLFFSLCRNLFRNNNTSTNNVLALKCLIRGKNNNNNKIVECLQLACV